LVAERSDFKLDELVEIAVGGLWGSESPTDKENTPVRVIRGVDAHKMSEREVVDLPVRWVSAKQLSTRTLKVGDVVLESSGACGRSYVIRERDIEKSPIPLSFSNFSRRLVPDPKVNPAYLGYRLRQAFESGEIASYVTGTAMPNLDVRSALGGMTISLPPLSEQREIAGILGALDDKIELNRRMNATLEAMARALFQSWFVDFDPVHAKAEGRQPVGMDAETAALFPDSFEDSALGRIPKGWAHIDLSAVADVSSGKRPSAQYEYQTPSASVPIFGGAGQTGWTDTALIYEPVILTGRVGTLGRVLRTEGPIWPSDNTLVVQPKALWINQLYFALQNVDLVSLNRGSSQPMITQHDIRSQLIVAADSPVSLQFEALVAPLVELQTMLNANIEQLADSRQALLPRLLSGQLRAGDVAA
jgi:type I restriction enzyme S subunit